MGTDPFLRGRDIHIIAGVQDPLLDIAENRLHGIIIRAAFG
jgi:hypothetical protein